VVCHPQPGLATIDLNAKSEISIYTSKKDMKGYVQNAVVWVSFGLLKITGNSTI